MIKLKTVKGKIIAGAVTVGVVSSVGFAFANTDAGEQLQQWYDAAFGNTVDSIEDEVTEYGEGLMPELEDEYNGMKEDATADINATRDSEITSAEDAIDAAKASHLESLGSTKEEILSGMGQQFYQDVFLPGYFEITALANEAEEFATNDLTDYTGAKGEEAVENVTDALNTARDGAVQELEDAIEAAKGAIESELANQEEITARNLKNQVDFAVRDVREAVNNLLDELVEEQQSIIADAAAELENEAIDALDEVVAGLGE
ncbi:hypothetical protein SAMN05216389_105118 [Oceanobacillus limi]|uniref:Uncharacterized protein n=1 Tax=Oceanobacillus limi TaxID=930131 RepID=A0A1I0BP10_9BACI|nr:hypothetical protein [Oceanobacillus limi]SET08800.1 hypothetical protein SAMN05216389_105118 [Oceanobacillus limi]